MRTLLALIIVMTAMSFPLSSEADRRYKVYKMNEFGRKSLLSEPEAIIEEDSLFGEWRVYESTPFGQPDLLKGPTYIIEKDSLFSSNSRLWGGDDLIAPPHHHQHEANHHNHSDCDEEEAEW